MRTRDPAHPGSLKRIIPFLKDVGQSVSSRNGALNRPTYYFLYNRLFPSIITSLVLISGTTICLFYNVHVEATINEF